MADNLTAQLDINDPLMKGRLTSSPKKLAELPLATNNPYDPETSPSDILKYLPPDGSMFGLYADPYATMVFYQPREGNHSGKYWLNERMEKHSFTDKELNLIDFLSTNRIATRNQIQRVVFEQEDSDLKIRDFIKKCRKRGIITAFSWVTPCNNGKKKPLIYGLTRIGAAAAQVLFQREVPKEFIFQPVVFNHSRGPKMSGFFHDLVSNELFSEFKRLDRVISWERKPSIRLKDGTTHKPGIATELIKDKGQFLTFWVEIFRITPDWIEHVTSRFQKTQLAFEKLPLQEQPKRVIVILDSDSRIPYIARLAEEHMPSVEVRYTTDERLLMGIGVDSFLLYDHQTNQMKRSPINFLSDDYAGMSAAEFFESQTFEIEDEDEFEE